MTAISAPPSESLTSVGRMDSTMAPTSQNHEVISAARQMRGVVRSSLTRRQVERKMFLSMTRSGAAEPVDGM